MNKGEAKTRNGRNKGAAKTTRNGRNKGAAKTTRNGRNKGVAKTFIFKIAWSRE